MRWLGSECYRADPPPFQGSTAQRYSDTVAFIRKSDVSSNQSAAGGSNRARNVTPCFQSLKSTPSPKPESQKYSIAKNRPSAEPLPPCQKQISKKPIDSSWYSDPSPLAHLFYDSGNFTFCFQSVPTWISFRRVQHYPSCGLLFMWCKNVQPIG